jgi:uncharacterized protein YukE
MLFNRIGSLGWLDCFYDAPDGGSGGGSDGGGGFESGGGTPSDPPAEPTVYDVNDDTLIRVPGRNEPVKFGEHFRGFQSQFTKASQRAAQLERELAARDARLAEVQRQQQQAQRQGNQPAQPSLADKLGQLPYLDGAAAAEMANSIYGEFKQRDQILVATLQELQKMRNVVNSLNQSHQGSAFEGKISKWVNDLGFPPEAVDLAKEIYLAYEGDDLDNEFPQILQNRWAQLEKLFAARQQAKIAAAKKPPFIPGRGGAAGPSKPLQLDPRLTAQQAADQIWDMFGEDQT